MRDAKAGRRKWIVVLPVTLLCLCPFVVIGIVMERGSKDPLARIAKEINSRGHCVIPGAGEVRAQSARMENGCLVLYGSTDPGKEPCVLVATWPDMGPEGICSARSVSIQHTCDPDERLKITFHQPTSLPGHILGRTFSVPVRKHKWIAKLRFAIRDLLRSRQSQKPRRVSP